MILDRRARSLVLTAFALAGVGAPLTAGDATATRAVSACASPAPDAASCATALLALARETASAIPSDPHVKDRARALEQVFEAVLASGDTARATAIAREIPNWRRGMAWAALAGESAARGDRVAAEAFLDEARRAAEAAFTDASSGQFASAATGQEWQRDRIRVAIAEVLERMGEREEAARLETGVVASEAGKVDAVRASSEPAERFEARLAALDRLLATGTFDTTRNATAALAQLHRRYYLEADRRAAAEQRIRGAWTILPVTERIALLLAMSQGALDAGDRAAAVAYATEALDLADAQRWLPEHQVPLLAAIASARARAGDLDGGRRLTARASALYEESRTRIADVFRAEALRPLADAWAANGDATEALRTYRLAVEEGSVNPNARPRALDLVATCCSMAAAKVLPDADLWRRMREIRASLGAPW